MPISSRNNKILTRRGKIINRFVKTLTFKTAWDRFPFCGNGSFQSVNYFGFRSLGKNTVTVNYGDGVTETFQFIGSGNDYRIYWNHLGEDTGYYVGNHIYQQNSGEDRFVSFTFSNPERLTHVDSYWTFLKGDYPIEAVFFPNVEYIRLQASRLIESFPNSLGGGLKQLNLQEALSSAVNYNKIPDSFFDNPLETLILFNGWNLNNINNSNLFKLNQLKDTLDTLYLNSCNIDLLPNELAELTLLEIFYCYNNPIISELPKSVEPLTNLTQLHLGNEGQNLLDNSLIDHSNHSNIVSFRLMFPNLDFSEIPIKWKGLKSLNTIGDFAKMCINDNRLNEFIPFIYQLVIETAFVDPTSPEAIASGYPYQHRAWTWGHSSLNVDSPIEPPPNFTQGVFNGGAQTNGQRVYELGANYAHLIN